MAKKSNPKKGEKEPLYVVQIADPKMVRKDLLEALRDVIIFMQGYEKFRKVQEEKMALFATLRRQLKDVNTLVNDRLRRLLPKGKLHAVRVSKSEQKVQETAAPQPTIPRDDLAELESQLKGIEQELQGMK